MSIITDHLSGLTAERLRTLVAYDRETGLFRRKMRRQGTRVDRSVGRRKYDGYISFSVDCVNTKHTALRGFMCLVRGRPES
jgi:hypothetical protein